MERNSRYEMRMPDSLKRKMQVITKIKKRNMSEVMIKLMNGYVKKHEHVLKNAAELTND